MTQEEFLDVIHNELNWLWTTATLSNKWDDAQVYQEESKDRIYEALIKYLEELMVY